MSIGEADYMPHHFVLSRLVETFKGAVSSI